MMNLATARQLASVDPSMHDGAMQIREASADDAAEACEVLRRSITELCHADHLGDAAALADWLSNKTPANVRTWVTRADNHVFVATRGSAIVAVGAVTSSGEITLNYVSPDARFTGVSKALLNRLEAKAWELGHTTCTLTSTETARRFYLSAGYQQQSSSSNPIAASSSYRMTKPLSAVHG
jgi:N-acetylglutamate synthase-like GNAT family acetyltransferase